MFYIIKNKKGIELSINFLVVIVLSFIILFFGARFIYNLAAEASELEQITSEELDRKIGELLCGGSEKVCLGIDRKIIKKGKLDIFELKIINILEEQDFIIDITRPNPRGFTKTGDPINADNLQWMPKTRTVSIKANEEKTFGVGIEVPKDAKSGTYIFNVDIQATKLPAGEEYTSLHKIYVEVT